MRFKPQIIAVNSEDSVNNHNRLTALIYISIYTERERAISFFNQTLVQSDYAVNGNECERAGGVGEEVVVVEGANAAGSSQVRVRVEYILGRRQPC